ncbi:MAG: response regulator, partial [Anaerolineae bacterium]|nr:response regulator [Anaerolineae bacterium]
MASREIRVLVVDDSAVVRSIIADSIAATADMKVVATAGDGRQVLEILETARPDVITLDIQMPNMDGLATLDAILARRPIPVIMVSSLTKLGAEITLDALDRGAVDYLEKPDYGAKTRAALREELPRKIRAAAGLDVERIIQIRRNRKQRRAEADKAAAGHLPASRAEKDQATP